MAKRALILLEGHPRGNGLLYVQAAQRLGLHPITLSTDPAQYDYLAAEGIETIRVDTDNLDALIRECSQLRAIYDNCWHHWLLGRRRVSLCGSWQALPAFQSTGTGPHIHRTMR